MTERKTRNYICGYLVSEAEANGFIDLVRLMIREGAKKPDAQLSFYREKAIMEMPDALLYSGNFDLWLKVARMIMPYVGSKELSRMDTFAIKINCMAAFDLDCMPEDELFTALMSLREIFQGLVMPDEQDADDALRIQTLLVGLSLANIKMLCLHHGYLES